jgi:hypothetical protein
MVNERDWNWEASLARKTTVNARASSKDSVPALRMQNLFNADLPARNFDISSLPGFPRRDRPLHSAC